MSTTLKSSAPHKAIFNSPLSADSVASGPCRTIAVANQKGGVGKTTTTVNLATAIAAVGKKVLIVDLDSQGNASTGLGIPRTARARGSFDILFEELAIEQVALPTIVPNLWVVTSSSELAGAEVELVGAEQREYRLRQALQRSAKNFDFIFIDCPPSLGFLTLNAMTAADAVLVPLQTEFFALEGLSQLYRTIQLVRQRTNKALEIQGIVFTMVDKRNRLSESVAQDVRQHFGEQVYEAMIPRSVRIAEAPSHGKPVLLYDVKSTGARAYGELASEFLKRENRRKPASKAESALQAVSDIQQDIATDDASRPAPATSAPTTQDHDSLNSTERKIA